MSGFLALGYFLWTRHRLALSLIAAYWLALIVQCNMLPQESEAALAWMVTCLSTCTLPFAYLFVIFSFSRDSRLEARESNFPSHLRHLPLPTYALVGWPLLWGSAAFALAWLVLGWGVVRPALRPLGIEPPLLWPCLMFAVALAWLQAIIWTPFPLPWLRPLALIPLMGLLVVLVPLTEAYISFSATGYGLLLVLMLAGYGAAVVGVAHARRGAGLYWTWPGWSAWLRWISSKGERPAFGSPRQAQVWFEWRRVGLAFPVIMFVSSLAWLPFTPRMAGFIDNAHRAGLPLVPPFLLRGVGSLWLVSICPLVFAPLLSSICGWEWGRLPGSRREVTLSSFLATRPMSAGIFVRTKLEAAALSTLAGWAVGATAILIWIALGGHAAEMAEAFGALRQRHPGGLLWISIGLFLGGALVLTWLQIVQGLWIGLSGRTWFKAIEALGFCFFISLPGLGQWLIRSPQHWQLISDWLPWLAGAAVALKCFFAFRVSRVIIRRGLVATNIVRGTLAVWVFSAIGLVSLLHWMLPSERAPLSALVLGVVLVVPLTRLLLAPLALSWNRHR